MQAHAGVAFEDLSSQLDVELSWLAEMRERLLLIRQRVTSEEALGSAQMQGAVMARVESALQSIERLRELLSEG